jgi:hypothetical protein
VTPVRDQYRAERGQAPLILLAVAGLILPGPAGAVQVRSGARGEGAAPARRLPAAVSAAQVMRDLYPRLFAPPLSRGRDPEPRHVSEAEVPRAGARGGRAGRASERMRAAASDVSFPGAGFAPTRVGVVARSEAHVRLGGSAAGGWSPCGRARQSWRPTWARRTERRHTGPGAATTDRSPAGWAMRQRAGAGEDCPCSSVAVMIFGRNGPSETLASLASDLRQVIGLLYVFRHRQATHVVLVLAARGISAEDARMPGTRPDDILPGRCRRRTSRSSAASTRPSTLET